MGGIQNGKPTTRGWMPGWIKAQQLRGPSVKNNTAFVRNLEETLDLKRSQKTLITLRTKGDTADFSSNDFLSISSSGLLRMAFYDELARNPNFQLGASGSRLMTGNTEYFEYVEREVAAFHGAEKALILMSGYEANGSIFSTIPRPGDAVVYDELVHASIHDGLRDTLARTKASFRHNDVESLYDTLLSIRESEPLIREGERSVIIAVESVYSMDGDICPLQELIDTAKEVFPLGNAQFMVDEAHATGVVGPQGRGLVSLLGLEKEVAIRMHTMSKAMGCVGGVILCNDSVRNMIINHSRQFCFSAAPSFPLLASIRAAYRLLQTGMTEQAQIRVQYLVKHFYHTVSTHPVWKRANQLGLLRIPVADDWDEQSSGPVTPVLPIHTRPRHNFYLMFHLQLAKYYAIAVGFPVVPKGHDRIRIVFHAGNTDAEVDGLAASVCEWAQEMVDIEDGKTVDKIPRAARIVYSWEEEAEEEAEAVKEITVGVKNDLVIETVELYNGSGGSSSSSSSIVDS